MLRWYLVHTKPSAEAVAEENLERQGYEVYLPRLLQSVLWRRERRQRVVPLFPRYLFLRLNEGCQALNPVRSTLGVTGVVRFGTRYGVVPEPVIRELRARADPHSGLHRMASRRLTAGARVTVQSGPFSGLSGVFEREAGAERVVVLLGLLGQYAPVCVPADSLAAC